MMKILTFRNTLLFTLIFSFGFTLFRNEPNNSVRLIHSWNQHVYSSYACLQDTTLNREAFDFALRGYYALFDQGRIENKKCLTVVDFTQHSSRKRLYVIDMASFQVAYKSYCSHGKNTGGEMAKQFSNRSGSLQSSLGFYLTSETYSGKFDHALRLDGLESSNFRARDRGIVVHGAEYATERFMAKNDSVLGRSYGCPALPIEESTEIIETIKEGSCFFIYADQPRYKQTSKLIRPEYFLNRVEDFI